MKVIRVSNGIGCRLRRIMLYAKQQCKQVLISKVGTRSIFPPPLGQQSLAPKQLSNQMPHKKGGLEEAPPFLLRVLANQDYFRWAQSGQTGDAISIAIAMPEQIFARRIAPEKANMAIN